MFDIGWTELMVIGIVALIVVGPKDLPGMFRTLGRFTAKAKGMAREFQRAMDQAADDAGVKDVASDLKNVASAKNMGLDAVKKAATGFDKWEPGSDDTASDGEENSVLGPETARLAAERAETARQNKAAAAARAAERAEAASATATPEPAEAAPAGADDVPATASASDQDQDASKT